MDFSFIYSEAIFHFLKKIEREARNVLVQEMNITLGTRRFWIGQTGYPLHFVVFEHPSRLGYFDSEMFEIGINKGYLFEPDERLKDLLRHEIAHYIAFIECGASIAHHGKEFHAICKRYGWKSEVSRASIRTNEAKVEGLRILKKIEKLFALSQSSQIHEAQLAMLKAHELLKKHNLNTIAEAKSEEEMYVQRVLKEKRNSAKLQAIASILKHFFVYPVFNHGKNCVYLEIFGSKINLEVAVYVGKFLENELERLWGNSKRLKGLRAKNSFFRGIAEGYSKKMHPHPEEKKGLILLENQLALAAKKAYSRLFSTQVKRHSDSAARKEGLREGQNLSIRPAIQKPAVDSKKLLS